MARSISQDNRSTPGSLMEGEGINGNPGQAAPAAQVIENIKEALDGLKKAVKAVLKQVEAYFGKLQELEEKLQQMLATLQQARAEAMRSKVPINGDHPIFAVISAEDVANMKEALDGLKTSAETVFMAAQIFLMNLQELEEKLQQLSAVPQEPQAGAASHVTASDIIFPSSNFAPPSSLKFSSDYIFKGNKTSPAEQDLGAGKRPRCQSESRARAREAVGERNAQLT
ncbi:Hypothetical predicted protein [Podarcis lilfordi]|uniref:Uncharacterized protein n=1 Tax=Podarcis lilfordi TaxID=74358 RepID=A0AA35LCE9_9SAUR|nr:Hypothetical predicted protein [Podarcis lilfordi]